MKDFRLSVALVTRNRPSSLERCLKSLRSQSVQPFEVLVSDDSSEGLEREIRSIAKRFDSTYVSGPRRGLYANRNHVAAQCRGTHIRTMDDDHEFPPGHLSACFAAVESDPSRIWIIAERAPSDLSDPNSVTCPPQLHPRGYSVPPNDTTDVWAIADGAAVYPREVFDRGHRYSERYVFGSTYLEWGSRLRWLGYRISLLEGTYVVHYHDPANRSYNDTRVELESRLFAAFCHSTYYQPTIVNRLFSLAEIGVVFARHPITGPPAVFRSLVAAARWYPVVRRGRKAEVADNNEQDSVRL